MFMHPARHFAIPAAAVPAREDAPPAGLSGLAAGTRVETARGWRDIAALRPGDRVYTWDGGLQPLVRLDRIAVPADEALALVRIPGGSFGACADLTLAPAQRLLLSVGRTADRPEAARALVPALALRGFAGTLARPARAGTVLWRPVFAAEEVIWANTGVALHCPGTDGAEGYFPTLEPGEIRALLGRMRARTAA